MELEGIITELIDEWSGFITDNKGNEYYYSTADTIDNEVLRINDIVLFKPVKVSGINKAILISKNSI